MRRDLVAAADCCAGCCCARPSASPEPTYAQLNDSSLPEFEGSWAPTNNEDLSNDTVPVDYMGLPLNEEGRARALSYSESQLGDDRAAVRGMGADLPHDGTVRDEDHRSVRSCRAEASSSSRSAPGTTSCRSTSGWTAGRHPRAYAEHTRSGFATRPLGRKYARHSHDAHEGELHPQERSAEQRSGDDDQSVLPARQLPDAASR